MRRSGVCVTRESPSVSTGSSKRHDDRHDRFDLEHATPKWRSPDAGHDRQRIATRGLAGGRWAVPAEQRVWLREERRPACPQQDPRERGAHSTIGCSDRAEQSRDGGRRRDVCGLLGGAFAGAAAGRPLPPRDGERVDAPAGGRSGRTVQRPSASIRRRPSTGTSRLARRRHTAPPRVIFDRRSTNAASQRSQPPGGLHLAA